MTANVTVKTNTKQNRVNQIDDNKFEVLTTASPHEGQANAAVIKLIADHLNLPPSCITIIRGHKSKHKLIQIDQ